MKRCLPRGLALFCLIALSAVASMPAGAMIFPGKDWERVAPEEEAVDGPMMKAALGYLEGACGQDGITETVVIRRGRMLFGGSRIDSRHDVFSCTKSYASLVTGLLIDDGKLSLDTRFADIFPEYRELYPDMTVEHALTLTDGFRGERHEPWKPEQPIFAPGEKMHYGYNALPVLARTLTKVADEPMRDLFYRRIAKPIGYEIALDWGTWGVIDEHPVHGASGGSKKGMFTTARQMARLGHLLLNKGRWDGEQVISAEYVEAATRPQAGPDIPLHRPDAWYQTIHGAYGYLFWVNGVRPDGKRLWPDAPPSTFAIQGNRNNICIVIPEWEMVVVRLGADDPIPAEHYNEVLKLLGQSLKDL